MRRTSLAEVPCRHHLTGVEDQNTKPAPGWAALLGGHSVDLELVHRAFSPPFEPWCERIPRAGEVLWALRSRVLDDAGSSAEGVAERATPLIERLNGALVVHAHAGRVHLDSVAHIDGQGAVRRTVFAKIDAVVRSMVAVGHAEVRDADGNLVPPLPPEPSAPQRWMHLAERDDDVQDLLVFTGRADNWFDIYKAIEMAQRLTGGEHKLWSLLDTSAAEVKNVKATANFHRHARTHRPDAPATLPEARSLLALMVRVVLSHRAR